MTSGVSAVVEKLKVSVAQLLESWLGMKRAINWMVTEV